VRSLARAIREGKLGIDGVAERLNGWIVDEAEGEGVAGEDGPEDSDTD
jgi:hypothetical protein